MFSNRKGRRRLFSASLGEAKLQIQVKQCGVYPGQGIAVQIVTLAEVFVGGGKGKRFCGNFQAVFFRMHWRKLVCDYGSQQETNVCCFLQEWDKSLLLA